MALKGNWTNKKDEVDFVKADDVNQLAEAIIAMEEQSSVIAANQTSIPQTVYATVNQDFKMYYKNVILREGSRLWLGNVSGITVKHYADYMLVTPLESGTYNIPWKVYDEKFQVINNGTIKVIASEDRAKTSTILVIGDSLVTQSQGFKSIREFYSESGGTATYIGTRGTEPNYHEGRAGWRAADYCTKASDSNYTNPFYNGGFDFAHYMASQGYDGVDIVVIQLGINDIFSMTHENFSATATANYIQQMVSSIVGYDSRIKVIVNLLSVPNGNGTAFTDTYGTRQIDFVNLANSIRMSAALRDKFEDSSFVTISPNNCVLDATADINDGVHPNASGYAKLGQTIYDTINGIFDGEAGGGEEPSGSLWDLNTRTGVARPMAGVTATAAREMKPDCYYYLDAYSGLCSASDKYMLSDYLATADALEFTVNAANGTSAGTLSAYGISVPLALEVGKTYTFTAQAASANMGVRLVTYAANGNGWTYETNTPICYNATNLCAYTITPEAGKGYAINFSQKSAGVGTKNVFTNISLIENE